MFSNPKNPFEPIGLTKNEKINAIIVDNKNVLYLSWGLCDGNNLPLDKVDTKSNEEIYVFNSVFAIITDFFKNNNPDIVFYQAIEQRKNIYLPPSGSDEPAIIFCLQGFVERPAESR